MARVSIDLAFDKSELLRTSVHFLRTIERPGIEDLPSRLGNMEAPTFLSGPQKIELLFSTPYVASSGEENAG